MTDEVEHVVPADGAGDRFDRTVARVAGTGRAEAKALVETGAALLDGNRVSPSTRVGVGSLVVVRPGLRAASLPASDVTYTIALEDQSFLVVDKPAGLVVHPGAGHDADTLVNGLVGKYPELRELGPERNWGLVHRLDRDTSGLLAVARTAAALSRLQEDLRERRVNRVYLALAAGREFDNATGTIEAPIARDPSRPTRMAVVTGGKPSRTHYTRLAGWPGRTLFEVVLETGRTHQIRVHFAAISAPLVGDTTYGGPPTDDLRRVWLHSHRLGFAHPDTSEDVAVRSPVPRELLEVLENLGAPETGSLPEA